MFTVVYFAKDVEDWFGYAKLNVFFHISASYLSFNIKHKLRTNSNNNIGDQQLNNILHTIDRRMIYISMNFIHE